MQKCSCHCKSMVKFPKVEVSLASAAVEMWDIMLANGQFLHKGDRWRSVVYFGLQSLK